MPTLDYLTRLKEFNLSKDFLLAFLTQGFGALFLLLSEIYVARVIGVKDFGVYSLIMTWVYVLSLVGTLGLNLCVLKFMPVYISQNNWNLAKGLKKKSIAWSLIFSFFLCLIGIYAFSKSNSEIHLSIAIASAFLIIPINSVSIIKQAIVRSYGFIQSALTPEYLIKPISLILLTYIASELNNYVTLKNTILFSILSATFGLIFIAFKQLKSMPAFIKDSTESYESKKWLTVSVPLLLVVGFNLINAKLAIVMLGVLSTPESVAIYSAANKISEAVLFGLVTSNAVIAPMISKLHSNKDHSQLQKTIQNASKFTLVITAPISFFLILFGSPILNFFGTEFSVGYSTLVILILSQSVIALSGPVGYLLSMTGNHSVTAKVITLSVFLNMILSFLLVPFFSYLGAAIGTCISVIFWNVILVRTCHSELNIRPYFRL